MLVVVIIMCYCAHCCASLATSSFLCGNNAGKVISCTDTRQKILITRLYFICCTVHNFNCFCLPGPARILPALLQKGKTQRRRQSAAAVWSVVFLSEGPMLTLAQIKCDIQIINNLLVTFNFDFETMILKYLTDFLLDILRLLWGEVRYTNAVIFVNCILNREVL